jgi:pimeloyl-ACP methyl ester carboxylesterase
MHIILVPGLWLDASTWGEVTPALEAAGHRTHPLTMPGVGASGEQAAGIGMADWVAAAVDALDGLDGPIALVGHSGGGNVVYGAVDARPERVSHVVFLDTFPPADGGSVSEFPVVDGVVPFPGWDFFDDSDVADLDPQTRGVPPAASWGSPHGACAAIRRSSRPRRGCRTARRSRPSTT